MEAIRDLFATLPIPIPTPGQRWTKEEISAIVNKVRNEDLDFRQCMESFNQILNKVVVTTDAVLQNQKRFYRGYSVTIEFENSERIRLNHDLYVDAGDSSNASLGRLYSLFRAADNDYAQADQRIEQAIAEAMQEFVVAADFEEVPNFERIYTMEQLRTSVPQGDPYHVPISREFLRDELCLNNDESQVIDVNYKIGCVSAARLHMPSSSPQGLPITHELQLVEVNPLFERGCILTLQSKNGEFTVILRVAWLGPPGTQSDCVIIE